MDACPWLQQSYKFMVMYEIGNSIYKLEYWQTKSGRAPQGIV